MRILAGRAHIFVKVIVVVPADARQQYALAHAILVIVDNRLRVRLRAVDRVYRRARVCVHEHVIAYFELSAGRGLLYAPQEYVVSLCIAF